MLSKMFILLINTVYFSAHAEWIDVNERLQHQSIKPKLCAELTAANETGFNVDSDICIKDGNFQVLKKFISNHNGKSIVTIMKLKIRVYDIECDGKIKKSFGHYYVDHHGNVVYQKPTFKVTYVDNCELISNVFIIDSHVDDSHVQEIKKKEYYNLPYSIRKKIESLDLSISLGIELNTRYKKFYKIFYSDSENSKVAGYLISYHVEDLVSAERFQILGRFDFNGIKIGELEYLKKE